MVVGGLNLFRHNLAPCSRFGTTIGQYFSYPELIRNSSPKREIKKFQV